MRIVPDPRTISLNKYDAPSSDTAAVVTIAAATDDLWAIDEIHVSLSADFAAAKKLNVTFGGNEKFAVDLIAKGLYRIRFSKGLMTGTKNEEVIVTLAADSGGASGSVNVNYR